LITSATGPSRLWSINTGSTTSNVFVWPSTGASEVSGKALVRQGYNFISWTNGGMNYWAISDLNLAELQQFVQLLQNQPAADLMTKFLSSRLEQVARFQNR
jgi:hypothetical protein